MVSWHALLLTNNVPQDELCHDSYLFLLLTLVSGKYDRASKAMLRINRFVIINRVPTFWVENFKTGISS